MKRLKFSPGMHIDKAAQLLVEAAKEHGTAKGRFNDVTLVATESTTAAQISAHYGETLSARAASPEGIAAAEWNLAEIKAAQAEHDRLVAALPSLDWSSDVAVLNWLCTFQPVSDRVGVVVDRETAAKAFIERGFRANANTGAYYRAEDRDNSFRYLVGQALDGLTSGPAIHPILLKFAGEWRTQFVGGDA